MSTTLPPARPATFTLSIVVEWENVLAADAWRPEGLLRALRAQTAALLEPAGDGPEAAWLARLRGPIEVVMAWNPQEVDVAPIRALADAHLGGASHLDLTWVEVPGARYYDLKNAGAEAARGDLLVFVDSDCVPRPGWLPTLVGSFHLAGATVVAGLTRIYPTDLRSRAFALCWVIPLVPEGTPNLAPHRNFQANNLAIFREVFLAFRYPVEPWRERGQCVTLAHDLRAAGHVIHRQLEANLDHPAPAGVAYILARAMCHGQEMLYNIRPRRSFPRVLGLAIHGTAKRLAAATWKTLRDHRRVGLPAWQIPAALAILWPFYALFGVGVLWSHLAPRDFGRRFRL